MNALPNTESPTAATRLQKIAATRRQGVAMGMSPWTWMRCRN